MFSFYSYCLISSTWWSVLSFILLVRCYYIILIILIILISIKSHNLLIILLISWIFILLTKSPFNIMYTGISRWNEIIITINAKWFYERVTLIMNVASFFINSIRNIESHFFFLIIIIRYSNRASPPLKPFIIILDFISE